MRLRDGTRVGIARIQMHPLASWAQGAGDGAGEVDVVLVKLARPVTVRTERIDTAQRREANDVFEESALDDGSGGFIRQEGVGWPSTEWWARMGTDVPSEHSAAGSPIWRRRAQDGGFILEGLRSIGSDAHSVVHATAFGAWVAHAIACDRAPDAAACDDRHTVK